MLQIAIPDKEYFNEKTGEFYTVKGQVITLEHSLMSVAKWEAKWKKPFLNTNNRTYEETIDYIRCMTLTQNVNPDIYEGLTRRDLNKINQYINDPMTATTFSGGNKNSRSNGRFITSELIYYWMTVHNIPFECQKWHLNRLMTLIRVCSEENAPKGKMNKRDLSNRNRSLNAARRQKYHTKG